MGHSTGEKLKQSPVVSMCSGDQILEFKESKMDRIFRAEIREERAEDKVCKIFRGSFIEFSFAYA